MPPVKLNFKMYQGSTFSEVLRWESSKKVYKAITNITQAAPVVITCGGHSIPDGWRFKTTNIGGMTELNSDTTYHTATVLTPDTIEINNINSIGYKPYTTGGIIEFNEPVDLAGFTARMQLRAKLEDTSILAEYSTENSSIIINPVASTIQIVVDATTTAGYIFSSAVYSLELISPDGIVNTIITGNISLIKEVTR